MSEPNAAPKGDSPLFGWFVRALEHKRLALIIAVITALVFIYTWIYYPVSQRHTGDFLAMLSHRDHKRGWWDGHGLGYGPVFALYDLAFRGVHDLPAMRAMYVVNLLLLVGAFAAIVQRFLPLPRRKQELGAAVVLWIVFYPTFQALRQNNVELTELFLLSSMLLALHRGRDGVAGVLLGLAGSTKIVPFAFVAYFLWRRKFRVVAAACLTGVVVFWGVVVLKHTSFAEAFADWRKWTMLPFPSQYEDNQALSGLVWRAFSHFDATSRWTIEHPTVFNARAAGMVTLLAQLLFTAVVGVSVVRSAGVFPRPARDPRVESLELGIVFLSVILLSPHNHTHYFTLIAWIFVAALREWPTPPGRAGRVAVVAMGLAFALSGPMLLWRVFDPILRRFGPITGIDVARLASLPALAGLLAVAAMLLVHRELCARRA